MEEMGAGGIDLDPVEARLLGPQGIDGKPLHHILDLGRFISLGM